ncbi:uncharacterized protein C9orf85 homolog [Mytilus edulis]|uniref:uncharacterized protein C9orf85 homolog n=1 Tax=Mytilus edulis TaxID=6550 RepID=UPI0039EDF0DD
MSTQRGNHKKGTQKHQNRTVFKNDLHDTSKRTKDINQLDRNGLCERCKEVIDWKVKYKKYKPLTTPKKCTRCAQKTVKKAYYIVCMPCISALNVCGKCGSKKELVSQPGPSASEQMSLDNQLKQDLEMLSERKRRTFLRLQAQGKLTAEEIEEKMKEELTKFDDDSFGESSEEDEEELCDSNADKKICATVNKDIIERVSKVTFSSDNVKAS